MKSSTLKIENNKDFENELAVIRGLNSFQNADISLYVDEKIEAQLTKKCKKFIIDTNVIFNDKLKFSFTINNTNYEIKQIGSSSNSSQFSANKSPVFSSSMEINTFYNTEFSQKSLYKVFFITDIKDIKTFHSYFETVTHTRDIEYYYDCLRIKVDDKTYDITQLKDELNGYFVFECFEEQSLNDFLQTCFSIRQAIGFITKLMIGDEEFVFDKQGKLYYSNYTRPTLRGMYNPIVTNPYSFLDIDEEVAKNYYRKLTRMSLENLSNFVAKIHNEPEFSAAILIILEATNIRSLLVIPSSFAGIIELLSKNIGIEELGIEIPIVDNNLRNKILSELYDVIDENSETLNSKSILKLKRRIGAINNPINKQHLTNNEKLTRPFEQLNLNLTLQDISIIEHRNDFFHGNILLKNDDRKTDENINLYMAYVSAKLFTLISKLILKSIGYNGYIYNQAKYLEKRINIKTEEEYFDLI